jgi:hypothetical protein
MGTHHRRRKKLLQRWRNQVHGPFVILLLILTTVFTIVTQTKAKNITYNLAIFPASEHTKELKKRMGTNTFMKLELEEPFDTWKAQLLDHIHKTLAPNVLKFANYEATFTVPRVSTAPMAISSDKEYTDMLECIGRTKDLICSVFVQECQQMPSSKVCRHVHNIYLLLTTLYLAEARERECSRGR